MAFTRLRELAHQAGYRCKKEDVRYTIQRDYKKEVSGYGEQWFVTIYAEVRAYRKVE